MVFSNEGVPVFNGNSGYIVEAVIGGEAPHDPGGRWCADIEDIQPVIGFQPDIEVVSVNSSPPGRICPGRA